ncbi:MAG: GAF domain-containing protein [Chloroflexota bacterium]
MNQSPKNPLLPFRSYNWLPRSRPNLSGLQRGILWLLLGVLMVGGYALIVTGFGLLFQRGLRIETPWLSGVVFFLLALAFLPLYQRLAEIIPRMGNTPQPTKRVELDANITALSRSLDNREVLQVMREQIRAVLQADDFHIFLYDSLSDSFQTVADQNGRATSELMFLTNSPLVKTLAARNTPLHLPVEKPLPDEQRSEHLRLALLNARILIPMQGSRQLLGWLALSEPAEGVFSEETLQQLEYLCSQAGLALERTQMIGNMQNRVREMNVLTRIAQGVNITLNPDDIYELIYAQITQLIVADEFRLILHSPQGDGLVQVFYIRGDERVSGQENVYLPAERSLEMTVVEEGRGMLTDDYGRESRQRGLLPLSEEAFAWLAAPLNAGAKPIGLICLAQRDPAARFTSEQLRILQALADQAAGGIVKARLLAESERRAHQLKTLNEVTRQLTSTLDPDLLLKNILRSAVEILNCEAGSLMMLDAQSDELVFRVVLGPVASELEGQRMPSSKGVVGKSFQSRQPVIVNDVHSSADWFSSPDKITGFVTRSLLVVPLIVKDSLLGVIEVVNRKDGSNFNLDDQELLSAFASQAAVAIENARLYTLTDQALRAKVEELSVMQRIDRELNTSLDVSRAMTITLDWAMRQSGAEAGLVGVVLAEGIRLVASQGYDDELTQFEQTTIPAGRIGLQTVIETRRVVRFYPNPAQAGLLRGVNSQVFIPIQREQTVIGLLLLESRQVEVCSDDALQFLQRLGDHAAIAIANAQLYSAVEAANVAKSEFVSFVAHELKNPMTSIKGYTELLAAKAVGAVNDAQANFLAVIRSNIDRMNTLVSDLNDLSKIEAGRMRLDYAPLRLKEIVEEVERSTRRQIEDKGQTLTVSLPADLPLLWADRVRLVQVLVNLVNNAHKYTEASGRINVGAIRSANEWDEKGPAEVVHVWVQDTGLGIAPEDQPKIFQKFFRSEDPRARESPGTGLGLNITRSLVEMQGGQIWFESEFRRGTTFHFTIPVAEQ